MNMSAALKTAGFAAACLVWLLAGLTLLGPMVGEQFFDTSGPVPRVRFETLTCPERLGLDEKGEILARFTNQSGRIQNYGTNIEALTTGETINASVACSHIYPVPNGKVGEAHCTVGPITSTLRVRLTVWAEGEDYPNTCELGCLNSFRSTCVIMPDIWTMLTRQDALVVNVVILALGLALVFFGARLWPSARPTARLVMVVFFAAPALMLALALYQTFDHWLAPALVIGPLPEAILAAALWLRGHPA